MRERERERGRGEHMIETSLLSSLCSENLSSLYTRNFAHKQNAYSLPCERRREMEKGRDREKERERERERERESTWGYVFLLIAFIIGSPTTTKRKKD
jgi:hypothetical protein